MADYGFVQSSTGKSSRSSSSFFTSFASKGLFDTESNVMSPTSILDSKPFSRFKNATKINRESEQKHHWENFDSRKVGLGIVDSLIDEDSHPKFSSPENRMVLSGSHLKIKIPPMPNSAFYPIHSPKFPPDFGIKTRNSNLGRFPPNSSPSSAKKSTFGSSNSGLEIPSSPSVFSGCLSVTETEDSNYVFSHKPNTMTSHVFENCIVESCCGFVGYQNNRFISSPSSYPSENFLSFCFTCRKKLGHGKDIFMYRGEKAFCSPDCRHQEMLSQEKMENDDGYGACS